MGYQLFQIMFTQCLGFEKVEAPKQRWKGSTIKYSGSMKCEAIRIGGSQKDQSPANSSGFSSSKSHSGIEITNNSARRKNRSSSLIRGPKMDVESIKRRFVQPKQQFSLIESTTSRYKHNANQARRASKPSIVSQNPSKKGKHDILPTQTSEQSSVIRWLDGRVSTLNLSYADNHESSFAEPRRQETPIWEKPYLPPQLPRQKKPKNTQLVTIESVTYSEQDSNQKTEKSIVLMSKEEYLMGARQVPNYLMESQIRTTSNQVTEIRIAESMIESNINTNWKFHGIWRHSSNEVAVIDTRTNFLFGLKCLSRYHRELAINQLTIYDRLTPHPNILALYHSFPYQNHFVIIQQFYETSLRTLVDRMTRQTVKALFKSIVEAIESMHNDHIAHTQINCQNIVSLYGEFKLLNFSQAVYNPTQEQRRKDFIGLGHTLMVLAENSLMEEKQGFEESFLSLVYMLQRGDCTTHSIKTHPFYN